MNGLNGSTEPPDYLARLSAFRKSDQERDALVEEIIHKYQELQLIYEQKCDDYSNEVESRRNWQGKAAKSERALMEHRQASGSNSFVVVILDGDGAIFKDYLWSLGKEGGAEAAHQLNAEIKSNLREIYPSANIDDWTVVVQIVLNLQGLAQKLHSCGIVTSPNEVLAFGRAFGLAQPLFAFIDVGMGKERADHKIRETLRLYLPNAQCKHCFFGPTHDNGYVVVLEGYKREFSSRLTLVETRPAESGFVELGLKLISFPKVFRSENLPNKIVSHGPPALVTQPMHPPPRTSSAVPVHKTPAAITIRNGITNQINAHSAPFVPGSSSPVQSADSAASNTWATVGKPSNGAKNINIAPKKSAPPPPRRFILQNVYDDRLDIKLPETDKVAEGRFAERMRTSGKMCNSYHLTGRCHAGEYCDYDHGAAPLSPGELLVLRHKARSRSCPQNHACRDFECTFGHHCRYGPSCTARETCWFSNTHGVDLKPAKKVFEDGSVEWLQSYFENTR